MNSDEILNKQDEYIKTIKHPKYKWNSIKRMLENNGISTYDISVFEDYYVSSILDNKDYSKEIEKHCRKNMKKNMAVIEKILPYVIDIIKDVVICYATK